MRKLLIALFCGFMLAGTAIASDFDPEKCTYPDLARKANKLSHEFEKVRWRAEDGNWCESAPGGGVALIKEREDLRGDKTLKALLNANQRIKECERKIEDLRADLQKTRDQTAHIVKMLRKATK